MKKVTPLLYNKLDIAVVYGSWLKLVVWQQGKCPLFLWTFVGE
ncbi:hypothetical protein TIFTF001_051829 [Ficus carica]|uniref:Uncharacterized protein n=1 Tax=Ficus carica TaxID=3494 RepID=A0AA88JEP1_FICCA|nr:hypothetical protein TIFTF001_051829 [Ficus carica]